MFMSLSLSLFIHSPGFLVSTGGCGELIQHMEAQVITHLLLKENLQRRFLENGIAMIHQGHKQPVLINLY